MKRFLIFIPLFFLSYFFKAQPCPSITSSSVTSPSCFASANGVIEINYTGGIQPYTVIWTGPVSQTVVTTALTHSIANVSAGSYSVSITDNNGCMASQNLSVLEPGAMTFYYYSTAATCGLANGTISLYLSGGTPGYTVAWNLPGAPTGTYVTNVPPGTWNVDAYDLHGCSIGQQTVAVAASPNVVVTGFSVTPPTCFGLSNGALTVNYSGGAAPYTINWSNSISPPITTAALSCSVSGIPQGVYSATVTDAYGCSMSQQVSINQPSQLNLLVSPSATICFGQTTQIAASGQGGTPVYTYSWYPPSLVGGGPHSVNPSNTFTYVVSVSDAKGCTTSPQVITVNVSPPLAVVGSSATICDGSAAVLTPIITSTGNGGPYSYYWSNSANTQSISVIGNAAASPTTYTVILGDGCTIPQAATVFTVAAQVCSGLNELEGASLSIFPNPTNGTLTINDPNIHKIELYDVSGKILFSKNLNEQSYQMQLQNFSEGIYFVKATYISGMNAVKKIVVGR